MAVQLTKEFWMNLIIALVTLTALGLSIWAFFAPCKSNFGDYSSSSDCIKINEKCDLTSDCCEPNNCIGELCRKPIPPPTYEQFKKVSNIAPFYGTELRPWVISYGSGSFELSLLPYCIPQLPSMKSNCYKLTNVSSPLKNCINGRGCSYNDEVFTSNVYNNLTKMVNSQKFIVPKGVNEKLKAKKGETVDLSSVYANIKDWEILDPPSFLS